MKEPIMSLIHLSLAALCKVCAKFSSPRPLSWSGVSSLYFYSFYIFGFQPFVYFPSPTSSRPMLPLSLHFLPSLSPFFQHPLYCFLRPFLLSIFIYFFRSRPSPLPDYHCPSFISRPPFLRFLCLLSIFYQVLELSSFILSLNIPFILLFLYSLLLSCFPLFVLYSFVHPPYVFFVWSRHGSLRLGLHPSF